MNKIDKIMRRLSSLLDEEQMFYLNQWVEEFDTSKEKLLFLENFENSFLKTKS